MSLIGDAHGPVLPIIMSSDPSPIGTPSAELLLAAIVDSSDDAILSKDLNGVITSWNKAAERIFGYSAHEIVGKPDTVLYPPERVGEEAEFLLRVRQGECVEHFETLRLAKDGRSVDVSVTMSPVKDAQGRIVGASSVARDVTERNRSSHADLLLAAIVSSSDDAIISKSLEGIITSWNEGARRIFGYSADEAIGQPVTMLIPESRRDEEPKIIERLRRGERFDHFETIRVRKNGEKFPVSLTISPVRNAAGRIVGASKIARDITERKRAADEREQLLESERAARSQAENANRMKDEFLSTVSHELRTPLNAIVGWTEVLEGGEQSREDIIYGVNVIKRNALMQAQLIEDLLDLGRISSGMMTLDIVPVDIRAIIAEAMASVEHGARAKRITITPRIGWIRGVLGDAKRLQQVTWNLLTNAIKFTPSGGKILITASRVNSRIEISVADSGQGMPADFLPHIFERFRQADSSTTRRHGGLGIGLALVKQLIELHGGDVRAESPGPGLGATFTLSLPVAALHEESRHPNDPGDKQATPAMPDLKGIKVLVVDDDQDSLAVIGRILIRQNAEVHSASSADEAMVQYVKYAPDVVISDIGMPEKDGYDLIRRIRQHPKGANTPAAALTALARSEDRTNALNAGFQSHMAKPMAAAEIVAMVRSLASMHRPECDVGLGSLRNQCSVG
jgi:PAS domain S-box-containing protein